MLLLLVCGLVVVHHRLKETRTGLDSATGVVYVLVFNLLLFSVSVQFVLSCSRWKLHSCLPGLRSWYEHVTDFCVCVDFRRSDAIHIVLLVPFEVVTRHSSV